jgi:transposase-like protein
MTIQFCPYCGSENFSYAGVADGGGDDGTSLCDEYDCEECGKSFEGNCVDYVYEDECEGYYYEN